MTARQAITILGIFVADTAYCTQRAPARGETVIGTSFTLGPGGKGSNQAIAAARLGATVNFISKVGDDAYASLAFATWADAGVHPLVERDPDSYTGAAGIFVEQSSASNAIVVCPGAATHISATDVQRHHRVIEQSAVFLTQLEQPLPAADQGLQIAAGSGVTTILNPAPATDLPDSLLAHCDFVTPNEIEASQLASMPVDTIAQARSAAEVLRQRGARQVVVTLGERGALLHTATRTTHIPAFSHGKAIDTSGAGDAFNGAFASAIASGRSALDAVQFGCRVAGVSVTRAGTADAMPALYDLP